MGPAGTPARNRAGPGRRGAGRVPLRPTLRTYGGRRLVLPARVHWAGRTRRKGLKERKERAESRERRGRWAQRVAAAFLMAVAKVDTSV